MYRSIYFVYNKDTCLSPHLVVKKCCDEVSVVRLAGVWPRDKQRAFWHTINIRVVDAFLFYHQYEWDVISAICMYSKHSRNYTRCVDKFICLGIIYMEQYWSLIKTLIKRYIYSKPFHSI